MQFRESLTVHRARVLWLVGLCLLGCATAANAQTLFLPPDTMVDVGKYTTLEECIAAVDRVEAQANRRQRQGVWDDTLPWNPAIFSKALNENVISTAKRCSARVQAATAPLSDYNLMVPLFLIANRDADVSVLASRRLAAVTARRAGAEAERVGVTDSLFQMLMDAKPARVSAGDSIAKAFDKSLSRPVPAKPMTKLMGMYMSLAGKASLAGDTTGMHRLAARTVALLDSLTPAERVALREEFDDGSDYDRLAYSAHVAKTGLGTLLDSLRVSTAAYVALQQSLWVDATGTRPEASGFPIGRQAPKLVGVAGTGADTTRPVPGKINLLYFVDRACTDVLILPVRLNSPSDCRSAAATLRRIAARYPALEITIVDRTRGYFMYVPPPTTAEEAALITKSLEAHQMPGTKVVGTTELLRLPAPDGRRIDSKTPPNFTPYSFGKSWTSEYGATFLIDRNGIIILPTGGLTGAESAGGLADMIGILLARPSTSLGATAPAH